MLEFGKLGAFEGGKERVVGREGESQSKKGVGKADLFY
jgi:hypothetical protein